MWLRSRPVTAGWEWVLLMLVVSRLIIFGVIALARLVFGPSATWHPGGVFSVLLQWDAELWYLGIARDATPSMPSFRRAWRSSRSIRC